MEAAFLKKEILGDAGSVKDGKKPKEEAPTIGDNEIRPNNMVQKKKNEMRPSKSIPSGGSDGKETSILANEDTS